MDILLVRHRGMTMMMDKGDSRGMVFKSFDFGVF